MNNRIKTFSKLDRHALIRTIGLAFLLFPVEASANGIVPLVNVFTGERTGITLALLIAIILFEAWLLMRFFGNGKFTQWLVASGETNIASSLAGSLYVLAFTDPWEMGFSAGSVLPLFLLTVVVETFVLNRRMRDSGVRGFPVAVKCLGVNAVSYAAIFAFQIGVTFALIGMGSQRDNERLRAWTDTNSLTGTTGHIYALDMSDRPRGSKLKRYDPGIRKWESMSDRCPDFYPLDWDVAGDVFVCKPSSFSDEQSEVRLYRIPSFDPIATISGKYSELSLSPDGKKLAAIEARGRAVASRNSSSYFDFGVKGIVNVFDVETGALARQSHRQALPHGMCWSADGKNLYFTSFRDEALFQPELEQMPGGTSYHRAPVDGPHAIGIFRFSPTGEAKEEFVVAGIHPIARPGTGSLFYHLENEIWERQPDGSAKRFEFRDVPSHTIEISPTGSHAAIPVHKKTPFTSGSFLTILSLGRPEQRLIVDTNSVYLIRWAANPDPVAQPQ